MRKLLFAALITAAAAPAQASSIEAVHASVDTEHSILTLSCSTCPAQPEAGQRAYRVPSLDGHVAEQKIVDKNGAQEVMRVDRFMGGSPVVTYSKTQGPILEEMQKANLKMEKARVAARKADLDALDAQAAAIQPPDNRNNAAMAGIDREATTAALGIEAEAAPFDPAKLSLRLN